MSEEERAGLSRERKPRPVEVIDMWKRDEAVKPPPTPPTPAPPAGAANPTAPTVAAPSHDVRPAGARDVVHIGKSVVIKGELNGSEDLTIEGHVEGKIELKDHVLTIGPNGRIRAAIFAKSVIVVGEVVGNVTATEKVDIRDNGSVDGDIVSPRVAIAEGAHFRGSVDMKKAAAAPAKGESRPEAKTESKPAGGVAPVANAPGTQKVGV
jgi:cytoskeletal protein CcmA (bactofilin family)